MKERVRIKITLKDWETERVINKEPLYVEVDAQLWRLLDERSKKEFAVNYLAQCTTFYYEVEEI